MRKRNSPDFVTRLWQRGLLALPSVAHPGVALSTQIFDQLVEFVLDDGNGPRAEVYQTNPICRDEIGVKLCAADG